MPYELPTACHGIVNRFTLARPAAGHVTPLAVRGTFAQLHAVTVANSNTELIDKAVFAPLKLPRPFAA